MQKIRIRTVYIVVLLAAVLFRCRALFEFFQSPFAVYSRIPGLDMKTHLELGKIFGGGEGVFALYRLAAALIPEPAGLVLIQCAAGCGTALLVTFISLRLFGRRSAALFSGLAAAWYGNAVLYELATLPETLNILVAAAALAAVLQAKRKRFSAVWCIPAGVLLALTATGRPTGCLAVLAALVWMGRHLYCRKARKGAAALAAGLLLVWGPVTLWNGLHGWPLPVYGSNFSYAVKVAGQAELTSWNVGTQPEQVSPLQIFGSVCRKFPKVFSIQEIPDNLNYYFLKDRFDFMQCSVPVALLVTAALAGMILLLFRRDRKGGLLILWMLALCAIFAAYYPAGRYRLGLYPCFAVFAGYFFSALGRPGKGSAACIGILAVALEWMLVPQPEIRRAADHTAWGMALQLQKAPAGEVDREFMEAVRLSRGGTRETARMIHRLLLANRTAEARQLLLTYPGNDPYRRFYDALLNIGEGQAQLARRKLEAMRENVPPEVMLQYYYFLGEACYRSGAGREAAKAYRELLKNVQDTERIRVIRAKIRAAESLPE